MQRLIYLLLAIFFGFLFIWWWVCELNSKKLLTDYSQLACTICFQKDSRANQTIFRFPYNSRSLVKDKVTQDSLQAITNHLKKYPNTQIVVTGYYASNEPTVNGFANLGLARAEDIKQNLVAAQVSPNQIATKAVAKPSLTIKQDTIIKAISVDFAQPPEKDQNKLQFQQGKENWTNAKEAEEKINQLAKKLTENPQEGVVVTGHYHPLELPNVTDKRSLQNLGLGRAKTVEEALVKKGIPADRIALDSKMENKNTKGDLQEFAIANITLAPIEIVAKVKNKDYFQFKENTPLPISNKMTTDSLTRTAKVLQKEKDTKINIVGLYNTKEKEPKNFSFDNLGLARADAIKKQLVAKGIKANKITTGSEQRNDLSFNNNTLYNGVEMSYQKYNNDSNNDKDKENVAPNFKGLLGFETTKATLIDNPTTQQELNKVSQKLKKDKEETLIITGYYTNKEKKPSDLKFNDLGLARANTIKQKLVKAGANGDKIVIKSKKINKPTPDNILPEAIIFDYKKPEKVANNTPAKKLFEPRNLYFDLGKSSLKIDKELTDFFDSLKLYLAQETAKKVLLTGHTDNKGNEAANLRLGKKRADKVKQQIISLGIAANRIQTSSQGEAKPIETNATPKGRQLNRRVEMVIQ